MNDEIFVEVGDKVSLNSGYIVEIIEEQNSEPYIGADVNDGESISFYKKDINCIKKSYVKPCGGDYENYWYFYTGAGYKTKQIDIANWARYELSSLFFDMSDEEIIKNHIFWGTESMSFNAFYNGDTFVLYYNIDSLPEDIKKDAQCARNNKR